MCSPSLLKVLVPLYIFGITVIEAQEVNLNPSPATLIAGGGDQTISVTSSSALAAIPFTVTWNSRVMPVKVDSTTSQFGTSFSLNLTAADLAVSELGHFALYDGRTNTLIASIDVPVVYPVTAAGTLYDASRGRLYISSAASPSPAYPNFYAVDPRFPANSLIALDVQTGKIANTLNLNAAGECNRDLR